ncbi:MAG TPA: hypothetical protein VM537_30510, partial [Anaerolineae bacterium]|nr:hypothetical protein [Anaerolineae bacterium]
LSAEEKSIALLNAALVSGNRLMEQAGGTAESFTDAWARLRVEIKNTTDAQKANAAEGVQPLLSRYADFLELSRENEEGLIGVAASVRMLTFMATGNAESVRNASLETHLLTLQWGKALEELEGLIPATGVLGMKQDTLANMTNRLNFFWKLLTFQFKDAGEQLTELIHQDDELSDKQARLGDTTKSLTAKTKELTEAQEEERRILHELQNVKEVDRSLTSSLSTFQAQLGQDVLDSAEMWDQYSAAIARAEQASVNYSTDANAARDATIRNTRANLIIAAVNSDLSDGLEDQGDKVAELRAEQAALGLEIDRLTASDGRAVVVKEKQTLSTNELALATAQLAVANQKMADADPGSEAYYRAAVQADNLREKIGGAASATTTYIDNTKRLDELRGKWSGLGGEIAGTKAEILGVIQMQLFQSTVSKMMVGDINDAELAYLELAGAALGLDTTFLHLERRSDKTAAALSDDQLEGAEAQEAARKEWELTVNAAINTSREVTQIGVGGANGMNALREPTQRAQLLVRELGGEADVTKTHIASMADESIPKMAGIRDMTGSAVARMIDLAIEARNAQGAIDEMHGKDITVNVNYVEHRGVGQPGASQREGIMDIPGNEMALGGDYYVNSPTPFIAGDKGWERAIFIPRGQPGYDAGTTAAAVAAASAGGTSSTNNSRTVNIIN